MLAAKPRCLAPAPRRTTASALVPRHRLQCRAVAPFGVAADAIQHVSFDSYVDIVDFHMSRVEMLLKATTAATELISQEIAIVFVCFIIMNVLTNRRHW